MCTDWFADVVGVVTKVSTNGARRLRWEVFALFSERRGITAASEGIFVPGFSPLSTELIQ